MESKASKPSRPPSILSQKGKINGAHEGSPPSPRDTRQSKYRERKLGKKEMRFSKLHLCGDLAHPQWLSSVRLMPLSLFSYSLSAEWLEQRCNATQLHGYEGHDLGMVRTTSRSKLKQCLELCITTWRKSAALESHIHLPLF
jgi:hypothetical protein